MELKKCLTQLDEVLSYLSDEDLNKIPQEIRDAIKEQKDIEYVWEYDTNKDITEQNLDINTVAMLSHLNMEYLLNDVQREHMKRLHDANEKRKEEEKRERFNPETIFKINNTHENLPAEIKNIKWYDKIIIFIKNIFHKKSGVQ